MIGVSKCAEWSSEYAEVKQILGIQVDYGRAMSLGGLGRYAAGIHFIGRPAGADCALRLLHSLDRAFLMRSPPKCLKPLAISVGRRRRARLESLMPCDWRVRQNMNGY